MGPIRLGFFKLNVPAMDSALAFWREAFDFAVTMTFDEPDFLEHVLALPGQESGPNLMLVQRKDGAEVKVASGHGPVGLFCDDIQSAYERAVERGGIAVLPPFEAGGAKVAILLSPQGHEVELVEIPQA